MDRDFTQLSDEQWTYINEKIPAAGQAHRDEGEGPVNDISLVLQMRSKIWKIGVDTTTTIDLTARSDTTSRARCIFPAASPARRRD